MLLHYQFSPDVFVKETRPDHDILHPFRRKAKCIAAVIVMFILPPFTLLQCYFSCDGRGMLRENAPTYHRIDKKWTNRNKSELNSLMHTWVGDVFNVSLACKWGFYFFIWSEIYAWTWLYYSFLFCILFFQVHDHALSEQYVTWIQGILQAFYCTYRRRITW